jgi:hypothetical protein
MNSKRHKYSYHITHLPIEANVGISHSHPQELKSGKSSFSKDFRGALARRRRRCCTSKGNKMTNVPKVLGHKNHQNESLKQILEP